MTESFTWTHAAVGNLRSSGKFDDLTIVNRPQIDPILERVVRYIKAFNPTLNLPLIDPTSGPDASLDALLTDDAIAFTSNGNISFQKAIWPVLLMMFKVYRGSNYIPNDKEFYAMMAYVQGHRFMRCITLYRRVIKEYTGKLLPLADIYINNITVKSETIVNSRVANEKGKGAIITTVNGRSVLRFQTDHVGSINVVPFGKTGVMLPSSMTVSQALLHYFMVLPKDASIILDYASVPGIPMMRIRNSISSSFVVDRFPTLGRAVKLSIDRVMSSITTKVDGSVECELVVSNRYLDMLPISSSPDYPFVCYHPGLMLSFILPGALDVPIEFSSST